MRRAATRLPGEECGARRRGFDAPKGAWYPFRVRVRGCVALLSAGFVAAGTVACGLTADFEGLQGGTRAVDADVDAASPDAASDSLADAPSDAGPVEAAASFCASLTTPVKLCTDFDEGQPVDAGWGATDLYGGEAISVDTVAFSPPGAFLSAINPSGAPSSARLLQAVPTQSPHVHVEFEMLLAPSDGTFELAVIHEVVADGTTYGLYYREVASALQVELRTLQSDGGMVDHIWPIGAPPSTWTRVDLDMDVSDAASIVVKQDGTTVVSETNEPTSTPSRTAMFVELGFYSFTPATAQASFDDAIVDWP